MYHHVRRHVLRRRCGGESGPGDHFRVVPVLGSILSDASGHPAHRRTGAENGVGVFGMIAAVAVCLSPYPLSVLFPGL